MAIRTTGASISGITPLVFTHAVFLMRRPEISQKCSTLFTSYVLALQVDAVGLIHALPCASRLPSPPPSPRYIHPGGGGGGSPTGLFANGGGSLLGQLLLPIPCSLFGLADNQKTMLTKDSRGFPYQIPKNVITVSKLHQKQTIIHRNTLQLQCHI